MTTTIIQYMRLFFENRQIPSDVAKEASERIAKTLTHDAHSSNANLHLLLVSFVDAYKASPETALQALSDSLID